jgi:hypothetical protein
MKDILFYKKQIIRNMSSEMSKDMPFKLEELINRINDITFIPPKKNDVVTNQLISIPKLDGKMLDIQLPFIKMTHGGFPQKGNSLYETFLQRANAISIPIQKDDTIYNFLAQLQKAIEDIINDLVPEDMKGKIEFQDIIREYENVKKAVTEYSLRVRLALKIKDLKNEDYEIETAIWKKENKSVKEVVVKTVEDVEKEIRYGSDVQLIIRLNKMYINTKNEGTKKDPKYKMGVTFKIMAAQVKSGSTMNNVNYKNNYTFNNDDDDDDDVKTDGPVINTDNIDTDNLDVDAEEEEEVEEEEDA